MSHLSSERLAAVAAEPPDAAELAHLASCASCARERAAHQRVLELANAEAAMIAAPLTTWETLAPALAAHGLIAHASVSRRSGAIHNAWLQAAAAVLLVTGGIAAGRYSAGAAIVPMDQASPSSMPALAVVRDSVPRFSSIEEAREAQNQSQVVYQTATAYLAQRDTTNQVVGSPSDMRRRLAALDQVSQTMGAALEDAPYDPVINGYYLTTLGQREATLRQLNTALPVGVRITSY
jgi:hypothetical protein